MKNKQAKVLANNSYSGAYQLLELEASDLARVAVPGQFVHLLIPNLDGSVLRRPFSIFNADADCISLLYKVVGRGTESLIRVNAGDLIDVVGPLGNGFPSCSNSAYPILVAGGYGVAPLLFLASTMKRKGVLFVGGASSKDILCVDDFLALGWDVEIATMDGSRGNKGLVTDVLNNWIAQRNDSTALEMFVCGPDGMLKAVGTVAIEHGWNAWLSLDKHMGCGVGACLACVQKIVNEHGQVEWKRVCKDGPVFEAKTVVW